MGCFKLQHIAAVHPQTRTTNRLGDSRVCQQQQSVPAAVCKAPELSSTSPQHVSTWLPTSNFLLCFCCCLTIRSACPYGHIQQAQRQELDFPPPHRGHRPCRDWNPALGLMQHLHSPTHHHQQRQTRHYQPTGSHPSSILLLERCLLLQRTPRQSQQHRVFGQQYPACRTH